MRKVDIIISKSIINEVKISGEGIQITNRNNKHTLNADKNKMILSLLDENYEKLFYKRKQNLHVYNSWDEFRVEYIEYICEYYNFNIFQNVNGEEKNIHLMDSIEVLENVPLYIMKEEGSRNDSALFYVLENYEETIMKHISKANASLQDVRESLVQLIDKLLINTNSSIVIDNMNQYSIDSKISYLIQRFIPSSLWVEMLKDSMNYYNKFVLKVIRDITIMNYCMVKAYSSEKPVLREISSEWIANYLYNIQYNMITLFSIPEVFMRSFSDENYCKALITHKIKPIMDDDQYYTKNIKSSTVGQVFMTIFDKLNITTYDEYIHYFEKANYGDKGLREVIHAYRIIFNRIKHASMVDIYIDDEELPAEMMHGFNYKMRLENMYIDMEIPQEYYDVMRYKNNRGIRIYRNGDDDYFKFTLNDLEISVKVLIGILHVLNR